MTTAAPHRNLCTDCGISRTEDPDRCGRACQFIRPDYAALEQRVHGRTRDLERGDERFFGVTRAMLRARRNPPAENAQWTGITTLIGQKLLETEAVSGVLCIGPDPEDSWKPQPRLITEPDAMAGCRGMRMGYAPLLALLEPAIAAGHRRLAVIGIPCQIYALRALEEELGLERLYVIGTPCSDNTTTENFHHFLEKLDDKPEDITYLEFLPDFHVELRFTDGRKRRIPFLMLPIADLPKDFFPLTCRTCVDYTNALADITVGYMGGSGEQWLITRNPRGVELLSLIEDELVLAPPTSSGNRRSAVAGFIENTRRACGGLPLRRMPGWLRPIVARLMPITGPKGLEFARTRLEMKAAESVLHLRREAPKRMRHMLPDYIWTLTAPYDITPEPGEVARESERDELIASDNSGDT
ncbi:putative coenzyme F420 hydrogenase beta subunit [Luminiphilus syltensis NOR5-1B]|uniref:Putative coenzyme F420 hydrogenase beta subunit n=1 Tax=Luminiphilus syltensis NOR5-1B TaxID=565045 RepID=B8KVX0_9GAMM|nr:Coenzyme F420 hydrogenase/dehydrogenase, beta subunit C-terminal domain [Luminiphilus syltensis]EED35174.1 putative coenzyme F420 hydrogenase beta subunit [Luminiphilus syltensis NOR5-1B]